MSLRSEVKWVDFIEKEFEKVATVRGGISLFKPSDALNLIKRCHNLNRKILGIDSFRITEQTTQPFLEHSIDFSFINASSGNWLEAEKFILEREHEGLVFEVVYE
jgi:hypothetical protein